MTSIDSQLLLNALSIVLIDLLLAGDNAVIIAMAVRSLPAKERKLGILIGAGMAVVLRVGLTFFASQLLEVQFLKLIGGAAVLWIGVKLLGQFAEEETGGKEAVGLLQAIWYVTVADITMSTDNILAVAGVSKGHIGLLIFGLGLSIPFVVFTSNLLSAMMNRYPIVVWVGAAVLGRVGGEMMITDPWVLTTLDPPGWVQYGVQAVFTLGVVLAGWMLMRRCRARRISAASCAD